MAASSVQITHLRALATVAETGSLTRAAEELGYTQPAVHLQLAALKRIVGGDVVRREGGRMELTDLGKRLLSPAQQALCALDAFDAAAHQYHATLKHTLRVGAGRSLGSYLFPQFATIIAAAWPTVSLEAKVMPAPAIVEALANDTIDLGLAMGLPYFTAASGRRVGSDIVAVPVSRVTVELLTAPGLAEAVHSGDLRTLRIIAPEYYEPVRDRLPSEFAALGDYEIEIEIAPNTEAAKASALASQGLALLPHYAARLEMRAGELVPCLTDRYRRDQALYLGRRRGHAHPDIPEFLTHLRGIQSLMRSALNIRYAKMKPPTRASGDAITLS